MNKIKLQELLSLPKYHAIILGCCWLIIQAFLYNTFGIETGYESAKYIEEANNILAAQGFSTSNFRFYAIEILLIALSLKLTGGYLLVVIIQLLVNAFSLIAFYRLVVRTSNNSIIAFIAALWLLGMIYYQLYNFYLFTESLFFSFTIIYTYLLFSYKKLNVVAIIAIILSLTVLLFTRPTGIFFIPATVLFLVFRFGQKKAGWWITASLAVAAALFYLLLNRALDAGGEWNFLLPYTEEHIICGVATIQQPHQINPPVNQNSVEGLWFIIQNHPDLFFKLAVKRLGAFWWAQRSFYSTWHNAYLALYFYPVYLLAVLGLIKFFRHHRAEVIFFSSYILLICITVMLSCDEWYNRFLFAILPFLLLLAAGSFAKKNAL